MSNFYTDVVCKSDLFTSTKRISTLDLLEPITRAAVVAILTDAAANGTPLMVFETFRSAARQAELFTRGATKLKEVGVHNYGLACDIVKCIDGEPSWKGSFEFLGALAKKHGLISGIDWGNPNVKHSFVDSVHVQRCTIADQPHLFNGSWYPTDKYNPYAT